MHMHRMRTCIALVPGNSGLRKEFLKLSPPPTATLQQVLPSVMPELALIRPRCQVNA